MSTERALESETTSREVRLAETWRFHESLVRGRHRVDTARHDRLTIAIDSCRSVRSTSLARDFRYG